MSVTGHRLTYPIRMVEKLLGLGREASPSAVANSLGFFISTYIIYRNLLL
jgi:hypothetical protein